LNTVIIRKMVLCARLLRQKWLSVLLLTAKKVGVMIAS
jgi:hypothetical protein